LDMARTLAVGGAGGNDLGGYEGMTWQGIEAAP
jgi:hypothetical protein